MLHAAVSLAASPTNITSDGTLGTKINQLDRIYQIIGGTRKGNNLFHSFGLFAVGQGDTAKFFNETGLTTKNILGRVTGKEISRIFGTIQTENFGAANLFLINPAGWIFGPTASLNVGGAFHVSTANHINFPGAQFSSATTADQLRNNAAFSFDPTSFGFLGPSAPISIEGTPGMTLLRVPNSQTLSVVGGDVQISGATLAAPGGRIQIASVASEGEVPLNGDSNVSSFRQLGQIRIKDNSLIGATDVAGNGGGIVLIRGGQLTVDRSRILANRRTGDGGGDRLIDLQARDEIMLKNNTQILSETNVAEKGGNINAKGGSLKIQGSVIQSTTLNPNGEGGHISVDVRELDLRGGSRITSSNVAGLRGGDVTVKATDSITISGSGSVLLSEVSGLPISKGNGGRLKIESPSASLRLDDRGSIVTRNLSGNANAKGGDIDVKVRSLGLSGGGEILSRATKGSGGSVKVTAADTITISGQGSGIRSGSTLLGSQTGVIDVEGRTLTLTGGAVIESGTGVDPQGGNMKVKARDSLLISNGGRISSQAASRDVGQVVVSAPTLIMDNGFIQASTRGPGNAGEISLNVRDLTLTRGSRIANSSEDLATGKGGDVTVRGYVGDSADTVTIAGGSGIFSNAEARGAGGSITIDARQVQLNDGTISASSTGTADATAGKITINAREAFQSDRGNVTTSARRAHGGDIAITAGQVQLSNGTTISATSSGTKDAGNISIKATDRFLSRNSTVTTEARQADGGNVVLTAGRLIHLANSKITTSVGSGQGHGGNITIDPQFVVLNHSQIRADAFGGPGGRVDITAKVYLTQDSILSASSALSTPGTINIQASITDVSGSLARLPEAVLHGAELLRASCAARLAGGKASSLVLAAREGLPLEPGGLLPSPLYLEGQASAPSAGPRMTWQNLPASRFTLLDSNEKGVRSERVWSQHGLPRAAFTIGCSG
jgi:filamentous hemagglutinin family protein